MGRDTKREPEETYLGQHESIASTTLQPRRFSTFQKRAMRTRSASTCVRVCSVSGRWTEQEEGVVSVRTR